MSGLSGARTMAVGTIASRATGFLRAASLAAVLGVSGVLDPFTLANTVPNIVFELLIGGILTSAAVPLLVRANKEGHGQAYIQRLLTLALLVLGTASALLVLLAPQVVDVYASASWDEQDRELAITFARYFLPQVLFYGLGALVGAYLNTQGRFGPPMWAPVLNNLIVLGTLLVFTLMPGPGELTASSITTAQVRVLGIGVTLGVVAQTVALLPALRATGLRLTPRFDFRGTGLGAAAALARWTLVYVVCNQIAYAVVVTLATDDSLGEGAYASYVLAFTLWQLPHAIVAVSVITALLPRLSQAHLDERTAELRSEVDRGLRLAISLLVPAAVAYVVLGRPIATLVFGNGETSADEARTIGTVLAVFACGLVAFSSYQLQLRAFYAMQDTRTPAFINLAVNLTMVAVDVVLFFVLPDDLKLIGLAVGQASSYVVGVVVCSGVLARRLARDPGGHVLRTAVRCALATVPAAAVALAVTLLSERHLPSGLGALLATAVGSAVLLVGYVSGARRLGVDEVEELVGPVKRKIISRLPGSRAAS